MLDAAKLGLVGLVREATGNPTNRITVRSVTTSGTVITAVLEEGFAGVFSNVEVGDAVFCAVVVQEQTGEQQVRGVCYWLLDFTHPPVVDDVDQVDDDEAETRSFEDIVTRVWNQKIRGDDYTSNLRQAASTLGASMDSRSEGANPVCIVAAIKASVHPEFIDKASNLVLAGYLPVGFECFPGLPNSLLAGYINVAFRFRNLVQNERVIVVPVKLSTAAAADHLTSHVEPGTIREVDPTRSFPAATTSSLRSECVNIAIDNGQVCLNIPYAGNVCISVPAWIPNGTVARACIDVCKKFGVPCGVEVYVEALGQRVASQSWGCC